MYKGAYTILKELMISTIDDTGNSKQDIVQRNGVAKNAFGSMAQKKLSMSMKARIRILKCFV